MSALHPSCDFKCHIIVRQRYFDIDYTNHVMLFSSLFSGFNVVAELCVLHDP